MTRSSCLILRQHKEQQVVKTFNTCNRDRDAGPMLGLLVSVGGKARKLYSMSLISLTSLSSSWLPIATGCEA